MVCVPSGLEEVPDLAVALGGPNVGPVGAGQLVPQPRDVKGQAVLEDRPVPELRRQSRVGRLERLLQRATTLLDGPDVLDHGGEKATRLLDRRADGLRTARDGPTATHQLLGSEGRDVV